MQRERERQRERETERERERDSDRERETLKEKESRKLKRKGGKMLNARYLRVLAWIKRRAGDFTNQRPGSTQHS